MKQLFSILATACALALSHLSYGQYVPPDCGAVEAILVERYYISDANDATDQDGGLLAEGSVTYRVFVDLKPGYVLESAFGNSNHPLTIQTTTLFFNNEDRGQITGDAIPSNRLGDNTVALDSYLTFSAASNNHLAVLKTEDPDGSIIGGDNNDGGSEGVAEGLLSNVTDEMGLALTEADGLIPGTIVSASTGQPGSVGTIGIDLSVFGDETIGGSFTTNNGAWFVLGGTAGPTDENRILIAQLTTTGTLTLELNFRVRIPTDLICNAPQCHTNMDFYKTLTPAEQEPSIANDRLCELPEPTFVLGTIGVKNDKQGELFFEVYPNPASDRIVLAVDPAVQHEVAYEVIDLYGKILKRGNLTQGGNGLEVIDLSHLSSGIYLISATKNGSRSTRRIVKH